MIIQNKHLSLTFDDNNGSLEAIHDVKRDVRYLDSPRHARLFRIFIPDEDRWIARYCDSHDSVVDRIALEDPATLRISYSALTTPEGEQLAIAVVVTVHLAEDADEAIFTIDITNHTTHLLNEVRFPWIGGYDVDVDQDRDIARVGYMRKFALRHLKTRDGHNLGKKGKRRSYAPRIPMIDISGAGGGIGCNFYCAEPQNMEAFIDSQSDGWDEQRSSWGFVLTPYLQPGENYASERFGLFAHDGDPTHTWMKFRQFHQSWWKKPEIPAHLYESLGLFNIIFRDFDGRHLRPLSELPAICRELREIGISDISVWDMMFETYLRAEDNSILEDEDPHRLEKMKEFVQIAREMGIHVNTMVNFRLVNQRSKQWATQFKPWATTGLYGNRIIESYPCRAHTAKLFHPEYGEGGHPLCQNNSDFQQWAIRLAEEVLDRTGMDALFIDQPFGSHHCFDEGHRHRPGIDENIGANQWIAQVRETVRKRDGFSYLIGEVPDIHNTQNIDLWWEWEWNQMSPEVIRYVMPESLQSWVIDGLEHEYQMNRAFSLGFQLSLNVRGLEDTLSDVPAFKERIRRLAALKRKIHPHIPYDRFIGRQGITVNADSSIDVEVNGYRTEHGLSVIAGDCTFRSQGGEATLILDPGMMEGDRFILHSEYGEEREFVPVLQNGKLQLSLQLRPWECVVLVEQK